MDTKSHLPYPPQHSQIQSENYASIKEKWQGVPDWLPLEANRVECTVTILYCTIYYIGIGDFLATFFVNNYPSKDT